MKVLSDNQMQKLKELGIDTSKASIRVGQMIFTQSDPWYGKEEYDVYLFDHEDNDTNCFVEEYRAFTSQDIIELLPHEVTDYADYQLLINKQRDSYSVSYENTDSFLVSFCRVELLDCLYEMLLWVIDNDYLETK